MRMMLLAAAVLFVAAPAFADGLCPNDRPQTAAAQTSATATPAPASASQQQSQPNG
ncbi:MAG: hypothetical protein JO010_08280 [Alphaproteobacteria bacterium]|nr:hypothetical protein [Alphaproteobacteria bacterium]